MNATDTTQTDIIHALSVLVAPGQVVEVRILDTRRGIISGYFNDPTQLVAAVTQWIGKASIYITVNEVNPDLLARVNNRLIEYAKRTTNDEDIVRRRWLLLDFDPVRLSGISSTEAEHAAARTRARECAQWLRDRGFGALIVVDSGNGAHVLVRIDLPNDAASTGLVKRCLEAVTLYFSDPVVNVDLTVHNAARIWKLYGTMAGKGDSTPDRPHRVARLVEVSPILTPEPLALLEQLAALAPDEAKGEPRQSDTGRGAFDLAHWIADHKLPVSGPHPWKDGRKWIFPVCPWNSDHTNKAAYIIQMAHGAIAAGCRHNSCQGKGWYELRDVVEPGWREGRGAEQDSIAT